ncbi:DUF4446 family protein [Paenibacillus sp. 481]|uniref:DUF4446 family protein n=1 Tax=Paenibacillus sp. 481 TaxID=2835869 RepID=UPI001E4DE00D|nr:DUF4446 family protein [Paenibacillus sp. 481]UHA75375.1 DUF4446 family protein [Paenibacillus sp. 481]
MNDVVKEWLPWLIICSAALSLMLFFIVIVQGSKLRKLRRKYDAMMGQTGVENLEMLLADMHNDIASLHEAKDVHQAALEQMKQEHTVHVRQINDRLKIMKSHVGIKRYNAFAEHGSDLSFSLALINEEHDGVVITGIHGREHSYVYAKPIDKGQSTYSLSPEEKHALEQASTRRGNAS